jgi:hypothetical protein
METNLKLILIGNNLQIIRSKLDYSNRPCKFTNLAME